MKLLPKSGIRLLTAQKPINRLGWWEGKFALFQMLATGGEGRCLSKGHLSAADNRGPRALIGRGRGLHAETAQSALMVVLKSVSGGLTSVIWIVLGTDNCHSQGQFVSISLRPVLGTVGANVVGQPGHHAVNFFPPVGVSVSIRPAHRIWCRMLSMALEKELKVLDYAQ